MKKIITVLVIACMMMSLFAFAPTASAADAISVATWDEFYAAVNEDPFGSYKLTADVTVGPGQTITSFYGFLDGAGHTVTVEATMFNQLGLGAYVHDLTVQSKDNAIVDFTPLCYIIKDDFTDEPVVLVNITNNVSCDTSTKETNQDCSGFVALMEGTGSVFMLNCVNNGNMASGNQAGGFIGRTWVSEANYTLINCINNGNISTTKNYAGGFMGCMDSGTNNITMKNCANYGDVYAVEGSAAGLIGYTNGKNSVILIENCYTEGSLTVNRPIDEANPEKHLNQKYNCAGLISRLDNGNTLDIKNCLVNISSITTTTTNGAYIAGWKSKEATIVTIENCYYVDINLGDLHADALELAEDGTVMGSKAADATELSSGVTMNALNKDNAGGWVQNIGIDALPKPATLTDVEIPVRDEIEDEDETTAGDDVTEAPDDDATQAPDDDATQAPDDDATQAPVDDATTAANGDDTADGGCASVAAVGVALVAILGTAIVFKKN